MNPVLTLLFATGEKAKCQPLTERIPAPMLPVLNRPVVAYAIELLVRQKQKQIHVALYEQSAAVEAYLGSGQRWGAKLVYHLQNKAWGEAGALVRAFPIARETMLLLPADILIDLDVEQALGFHQVQGAALTQVIFRSGDQRAPTGVFLVEPRILPLIPPRTAFSLEQVLALLPQDQAAEYVFEGYWNGLENICQYYKAPFELLEAAGKASEPKSHDTPNEPAQGTLRHLAIEGHQHTPGIWMGRNNAIHPSARLAPPVYLHENIQVGRDVSLGPRVILGKNVVVDHEATLQDAVVLANTYVGQLMQVEQRVVYQDLLIHACTGESVNLHDPQFLAEVQPDLSQYGLQRAFDVLFAAMTLVLTSPLLVICALALWLSGKPAITRHIRWHTRRAGEQGVLGAFELLRFTTRSPEGVPTRIGSFLEALELDRLPEWFNVLSGDCSAVGVKPLTQAEYAQLTEEWHQQRFTTPAGITGLWYLHTNPSSSLEEVLVNDVYYAATRSGRGNLRILLETLLSWLRNTISGKRFATATSGKV